MLRQRLLSSAHVFLPKWKEEHHSLTWNSDPWSETESWALVDKSSPFLSNSLSYHYHWNSKGLLGVNLIRLNNKLSLVETNLKMSLFAFPSFPIHSPGFSLLFPGLILINKIVTQKLCLASALWKKKQRLRY